jgi:methionyl-tRNA formyltransferase
MNVVILTQDDPFFLAKNIDYLIKKLPKHSKVVATVLFDVSPFGKQPSFVDKMKDTQKIFGWRFFMYYGFKFLFSKLDSANSVSKMLAKNQVPILKLEGSVNSKKNRELIATYKPDLLVSIGGNQIFKLPLINLAPKGCINLHTALLPKYRGLMPSFWVMRHNEKYTGVSVFFVDEGIDSGPIIVQKKIEIGDRSQEELIKHTKQIGMDSILEAIELIETNKVALIPNPIEEMTYFTFPTREDVLAFRANGKRFF